ncbi:MAG: phage integrase SAM-like domain-containing protein, partial [Aequorivita sp.]|nr:phage integrase SAM-like domain-containing protein [Aequorivita sp.]
SKSNPAEIYLRLSLGRGKDLQRKIDLSTNPKDWNIKKGLPIEPKQSKLNSLTENYQEKLRAYNDLSEKLRGLKDSIFKKLNDANSTGVEVTGDWLQFNIDLHFGRVSETSISEYVIDSIQNILDTSATRKNGKGSLGLSKSRLNSYNSLIKIFKEFEICSKKKYKVKDINIPFESEFLKWLINTKRYSNGYALKKMADLKTVCYDAETFGIETHPQIKKVGTAKGKSFLPVYLTPSELEKIKGVDLYRESLKNARKWLLLGCNIGQRGGDLLQLTKDNFVTRNNGLEVIELVQEKTNKAVTIPVLETTKEILETGLPYKISLQKFNDCIKEICQKAGINQMVEGTKICMIDEEGNIIPKDENGNYIKKGVKRKIHGNYHKYDLLSSHTCRRSFATNQYGILPTPLIMKITAHSTEKMFLKYIGKDSLDYAQQIADFYELQALKSKKEPQLNLVKKAN